MSIPIDNPAGRLYALLNKTAQLGGFEREKWREVFEIELSEESDFQIVARLFEMLKLVDDVEEAFLQIDDGTDVSHFLATLPDVRKMLRRSAIQTIDAPYAEDEHINVHLMGLLAVAAQTLSVHHLEPIVEEETLAEVLVEVRELYEEVRASAINAELRIFILSSLHQIDRAIQHFRILGVPGLQDALIQITGELYYQHRDISTKTASDEQHGNWFARFTNVIAKVDSIVRFAGTGMKTLDSAKSAGSRLMALLGPGSGS